MISIQTANGPKLIIPRGVKRVDGSLKAFAKISMRSAGGDIDLWDASVGVLSVSATPNVVSGARALPEPTTVTTNSTTAFAGGAVGAVTWVWTKDAGASSWSISGANSATAQFNRAGLAPEDGQDNAIFRATATDSIGQTGSATVDAFVINYGGF